MKLTGILTLSSHLATCSGCFYPVHPVPIPLKVQGDLDALRLIFTLGVEVDHGPLLSLQGLKQFDCLEIANRALAFWSWKVFHWSSVSSTLQMCKRIKEF